MHAGICSSIRYKKRDLKWLRKKYKPGMQIGITEIRDEGQGNRYTKHRIYTVVKAFPFHLSCIDEYGFRRSFNYFWLQSHGKII